MPHDRERDHNRDSHSRHRDRDSGRDRDRDRDRDGGYSGERSRHGEDRDRERDRDRDRDRYHPYQRRSPPRRPVSDRPSSSYHESHISQQQRVNKPNYYATYQQREREEEHRQQEQSTATTDKDHNNSKTANNGIISSKAEEEHKQPLSLPKKLVPLSSLAEVVRRQAESNDLQNKPVFLSKKEREALALKRLEEQRKKHELDTAKQEQIMQEVIHNNNNRRRTQDTGHSRDSQSTHRDNNSKASSNNSTFTQRSTNPRNGLTSSPPSSQLSSSKSATVSPDEALRAKELELIKAQHLGQSLNNKSSNSSSSAASSTKYKFTFDWQPTDDTSADPYALYSRRHESALLYGRGFVGGMDRKEQRKKQVFFEEVAKQRLKDSILLQQQLEEEQQGQEEWEAQQPQQPRIQSAVDQLLGKEETLMGAQCHWSKKKLSEMEERDWRIFKEDFEISTRGNRVASPIRYWHESGLPQIILDTLQRVGYKDPTAIQRAAIPVGLQNRDVVGIAETGSGKTLAFLLPMLVYLSQLPPITTITAEAGPYAMIMAPTRELAQQISDECEKFGQPLGIRNVSIVGGLAIEEQGFKLRAGTEIVIGTPGRLIDCIDKRYLVLHQCNYVVLDEADRMIDMNFEPQIIRVMESMPSSNLRPLEEDEADRGGPDGKQEDSKQTEAKKIDDDTVMTATSTSSSTGSTIQASATKRYRQTIMFSATMPPKVIHLAKKYLRNPVEIAVGDRRGKAASNVEQRVEWCTNEHDKRHKLVSIIQNDTPPFIIFCNLKRTCDFVYKALTELNVRCVVLHGGKVQEVREEALAQFKAGYLDVLIATDVMGRGIDISGVQQVINYEMPSDIQKYTHRIGRTGRAGNKGIATSFLTEGDTEIMYDLKQMLQESNAVIPPQLNTHEAAKYKPGSQPDSFKKNKIVYSKDTQD